MKARQFLGVAITLAAIAISGCGGGGEAPAEPVRVKSQQEQTAPLDATGSVPAATRPGLSQLTPPASEAVSQPQEKTSSQQRGDANVERQKFNALDLSLEGNVAYTVSNGAVRLQADQVINRRLSGTSGTIRLELWAFGTPYNGSPSFGYKLGQATLGTLPAGWYFDTIDSTVAQLTTIPSGTWYMAFVLTEYNSSTTLNDRYEPIDWINFSAPWVIGSPTPATVTVYELYNTTTNHYFRTANAAEVDGIAQGSAGPGWIRTGDDFKAYEAQAGGVGNDVCRFYSYYSNSHFYTAADAECNGLRSRVNEWNFENFSFRIQMPSNGNCGALKPVYRLYNNRFQYRDSNHRFTTSYSEAMRLAAAPNNWWYEGIVFCALN